MGRMWVFGSWIIGLFWVKDKGYFSLWGENYEERIKANAREEIINESVSQNGTYVNMKSYFYKITRNEKILRWEKKILRLLTLDDLRVPSKVGAEFIEGDVWYQIERWAEQSAEIMVVKSLISAYQKSCGIVEI